MSGERRTITYTPIEVRDRKSPMVVLCASLWLCAAIAGAWLADLKVARDSVIMPPQQSLMVVIKQRHVTPAWASWINSLSPRVAVMVISDRELSYAWAEGIKLRHGHDVATEGLLTDGVRWTPLPHSPPEK